MAIHIMAIEDEPQYKEVWVCPDRYCNGWWRLPGYCPHHGYKRKFVRAPNWLKCPCCYRKQKVHTYCTECGSRLIRRWGWMDWGRTKLVRIGLIGTHNERID